MASTTKYIAGEPVELLVRGLPGMRADRQSDGSVLVSFTMEHEVFAAWHRAIERYGADLIEPGRFDRIEDRQAKAFARLVSEVSSESTATEEETDI